MSDDVRLVIVCTIFMAIYYFALASRGYSRLFDPVGGGLTFNSMLDHLLRGQFDVDPKAIGDEAFLRGGKAYAYFGIVPAFARIILIPFGKLLTTDITRAACAFAATVNGAFNILSLVALDRRTGAAHRGVLFWSFLLAIVLGTPRVAFLQASTYQEVMLWAGALAAMFVYCTLHGLIVGRRGFSGGCLFTMSVLAGLALMTKVSTAIALYAALVLLILVLALEQAEPLRGAAHFGALIKSLLSARYLAPLFILGLFALSCGVVNYGRFGDPLTFQDLRYQVNMNAIFPGRLEVLAASGNFNLARLPYGLMYYFLPLWMVVTSNGTFLFEAFERRMMHGAELPPSSFFVSDPLLFFLAGVLLVYCWRHGAVVRSLFDPAQAAAVLCGLSLSGFLMLIAVYMAFRYRMEFYPFLQLAAFLGFYVLSAEKSRAMVRRAINAGACLAAATGIAAAHALLILTVLSPFGPVSPSPRANETKFPAAGWIAFYRAQVEAFDPTIERSLK